MISLAAQEEHAEGGGGDRLLQTTCGNHEGLITSRKLINTGSAWSHQNTDVFLSQLPVASAPARARQVELFNFFAFFQAVTHNV